MQAIIPHFQERGRGHLINVSSLLGRVPLVSHRSIYSAAKSGVNVLTSNARMDLKTKYAGIHVSLVCPEWSKRIFTELPTRPKYPEQAVKSAR
jgi:short-subunit dehydrogenase